MISLTEELQAYYPVWLSDICTIADALEMITNVGKLVDKEEEAKKLVEKIKRGFGELPKLSKHKTAYLIWKDPYMAVGGDTFINNMWGPVVLKMF